MAGHIGNMWYTVALVAGFLAVLQGGLLLEQVLLHPFHGVLTKQPLQLGLLRMQLEMHLKGGFTRHIMLLLTFAKLDSVDFVLMQFLKEAS